MTVENLTFPQLGADVAVLRRTASEWQIGVEPDRSLILGGVDLDHLLALMDGRHSLVSVRERAAEHGLTGAQFDAALSALVSVGALRAGRPRRPTGPHAKHRVVLWGAGPLGLAIASGLVRSGVGSLDVVDDVRAETACVALADLGSTTLRPFSRRTAPDAESAGVTLVALDTAEPDRTITEHLLRADVAHLIVRITSGTALVGPLVLPGRTCCLRCLDLTRRDADPGWPILLPQLERLRLPPAPDLLSWAAATAVVQALGHLAGSTPETTGATLELSALDYLLRLRLWPVHAECGCSWWTRTE